MKYMQSLAVLALLLEGSSASNDQNNEIGKKLEQLKIQISEDVKITNKLNKSINHLKQGHDETLIVMNQQIKKHSLNASIIESKDKYDNLTTLEKIKLDNIADSEENKAAIDHLQKDLD